MSKRDKHDLARLERHHEQALHEAQERYCRTCGTPNWQRAPGARCEICGGHIVAGKRSDEIHSSDCFIERPKCAVTECQASGTEALGPLYEVKWYCKRHYEERNPQRSSAPRRRA
jgi:hypothetical protein